MKISVHNFESYMLGKQVVLGTVGFCNTFAIFRTAKRKRKQKYSKTSKTPVKTTYS